ncbi:PREDICTED: uncharacterized protein LOC104809557 [Tarenaya hassleriana]|uniref:uncharacterized protein LOC104809557 n=1 Tax=Tarenaya hassleriana TaxID=28532 RepID=UPI00053C0EA7|nr:PREDICTED: uncharacterized protein LOC104809557 [Tarenaya hassleriana]
MGCCVSSTSATADKNSGDPSPASDNNRPPSPRPRTPAIVEEETVKEVLSETTLLTSSNDEPVVEDETQKPIMEKIQEYGDKPGIYKPGRGHEPTRPDSVDPVEDGSELSEICSLSVSESVSSTVVNPYDDGDEEVKQRKFQGTRQRSPAKPRTQVTNRRSEQSPAKRSVGGSGSVRLVHPSPGRRSGPGMADPADRSGRRSRSPATNRSVMSPVTGRGARRKNNESPGRVRSDPGKSESPGLVRLDPGKSESEQLSQWPSSGAAAGNYNCAPRESLENPLVSLECFIFL